MNFIVCECYLNVFKWVKYSSWLYRKYTSQSTHKCTINIHFLSFIVIFLSRVSILLGCWTNLLKVPPETYPLSWFLSRCSVIRIPYAVARWESNCNGFPVMDPHKLLHPLFSAARPIIFGNSSWFPSWRKGIFLTRLPCVNCHNVFHAWGSHFLKRMELLQHRCCWEVVGTIFL